MFKQLCNAPIGHCLILLSKHCIITRLKQFLLPFSLFLFIFVFFSIYVLFISFFPLSLFHHSFFRLSLFLSCYMMQQCVTIKGAQTFVKPRIAGFLSAPRHLMNCSSEIKLIEFKETSSFRLVLTGHRATLVRVVFNS